MLHPNKEEMNEAIPNILNEYPYFEIDNLSIIQIQFKNPCKTQMELIWRISLKILKKVHFIYNLNLA